MRNKRYCFLIMNVIIFVCLTSITFAQDFTGKILLNLTADTNQFVWGEDIWLELTVVNLLDREITIPYPTQDYDLKLIVTTEDEKQIYGWPHGAPGGDSITLPQHGSWEESQRLAQVNDTTNRGRPGGGLIAGEYKAQAILGDVQSNYFTFRVRDPNEEELFLAREIIKRLIEFQSSEQAIEDGKKLLRKYPNSVYTPNIHIWLGTHLNTKGIIEKRSDELKALALEFIERYPKSGEVGRVIGTYEIAIRYKMGISKRQKASPEQWKNIEEKLLELKKRFSHPRVSRHVDRYIRQAKAWEKVLEREQKK
ncbi:MAG: hypothetical protein QME52_09290 [Bacteroidota bacterium]|nr:hypothetical protein [Bacteroidota bacterium]